MAWVGGLLRGNVPGACSVDERATSDADCFRRISGESAFETAGLLAVGLVLFMLFELTINVDIFRNLPALPRQSSDLA